MRILLRTRLSGHALLVATRRRRGATLVMMSILLVAFLGVGAIAADIGRFYSVVTELQTAADAGALAGALTLQKTPNNPEEPDVDTAVVNFVATTNLADGSPALVTANDVRVAVYTPPNRPSTRPLDFDLVGRRPNAVRVTVSAAPHGIFTQLIGRAANLPLSRTSVAWVSNLSGRCVKPWGLPYRALYEAVSGTTGASDPAPDLDPRDLVRYLQRDPQNRMFVALGPKLSATAPSDGNWAGFSLSGLAGDFAFIDAIQGCVTQILDVDNTLGRALPFQIDSYVTWTTQAIQNSDICHRRPYPDAGCYPAGGGLTGVPVDVAWNDAPTGDALTFRYVGKFLINCYYATPGEACGVKPGATYPVGTIVGTMPEIKSRTLLPDDVLGIAPSNVQRIILVR